MLNSIKKLSPVVNKNLFNNNSLKNLKTKIFKFYTTSAQNETLKKSKFKNNRSLLLSIFGLGSISLLSFYQISPDFQKNKIQLESLKEEEPIERIDEDLINKYIIEQVDNAKKFPGIFLWGSNKYGLVSKDKKKTHVKTPSKVKFFEGQAIRDLAFSSEHAVAVDANGDLYQWGTGHFIDLNPNDDIYPDPELTLKGKNITKVCLTLDTVFALSKSGEVYVVSAKQNALVQSNKEEQKGWFWSSSANESGCDKLILPSLGWGERVTSLSSGQYHCALLTSSGRLFTLSTQPDSASLGTGFDSVDPFHVYQVNVPNKVVEVVCGDYHTLFRLNDNKVFGFGDNKLGQLATGDYNLNRIQFLSPIDITPNLITLSYIHQSYVTSIHAGGDTSAFIINKIKGDHKEVELLTCGYGQWGQLGNGRFVQAQGTPVKVSSLSNKLEYSELEGKAVPVLFDNISISPTHVFATYHNNMGQQFGKPVYGWGRNQEHELNLLKKSSHSTPLPPNLPIYPNQTKIKNDTISEGWLQLADHIQCKVNNQSIVIDQVIIAGDKVSGLFSKIV